MHTDLRLLNYVQTSLKNQNPKISRSLPDLIAQALNFKSYSSLESAHVKSRVDLNDFNTVNHLLYDHDSTHDWVNDGLPKARPLFVRLFSENGSEALKSINVDEFVASIFNAAIEYRDNEEDAAIQCEHCGCRQDSLSDDGAMDYITSADDNDDFIVLCPKCLSAARLASSIRSVDGIDRWFPTLDARFTAGEHSI